MKKKLRWFAATALPPKAANKEDAMTVVSRLEVDSASFYPPCKLTLKYRNFETLQVDNLLLTH